MPARPLGLRREVVLFLPTALFLLVVIACFNLLSYRNALRDMETERISAATTLAAHAAGELARGPVPTAERLRLLAPTAAAAIVHRQDGRSIGRVGAPLAVDLAELVGAEQPQRAVAFGPSKLDEPLVVAVAPFERAEGRYVLQLDLPAARLAAQLDGLGRLLLLNGLALGALMLLVLLFLRHLLAPFESLLESARRVDRTGDESVDETRFLVETFERAVAALERDEDSSSDDIAVLQRTLAPSLESGFMLLDRDGVVLSVNELGARLLSIPAGVAGRPLPELLAEHGATHREEIEHLVAEAVDGGATIQRRECEIGPDGDRRVLGLGIHPLRRDGEARGFIALFTDLTEVKARARQEQISRSLSQLGEIAAGVAHEMRNGLGTLKGYLTLMTMEGDEESARGYLAEMRAESEHLERVLSDFLSFARPESMKGGVVELGSLLERAIADPTLERSILLERPDAPIELTGDGELLERAVRNLLQNAVEAQRENGCEEKIRVRLSRDADGALIEIEDSGPGLPDALRESVFQPFVSGRADGVGLGLALTHRIVELHGGELRLENRRPEGARATVRLPVTIDT